MEFIASTIIAFMLFCVSYILDGKTEKKTTRKLEQILESIRKQGSHDFNTQRIRCLQGVWMGNVVQQDGPKGHPIDFPLEARLEVTSLQEVVGHLIYTFDDVITTLDIQGKAMDNRVIVLYFFDANKSIMRFGTIMLELSALANALDGHFVAYAAETDAIVTGEIMLIKESSKCDR